MGEKADEIIQFYYNRLNRSDWQIVNKSSKLLERKKSVMMYINTRTILVPRTKIALIKVTQISNDCHQ